MPEYIIETNKLSHYFGKQLVVNELSLQVKKGSIYGFLGQNGAGKTTTIKLLLNLLKSPKESIFLFGKSLASNRIASLRKIGSLVEQPAIYGHLSGKENLINRCILLSLSPKKCEDILNLVGLKEAANKKAANYSLGMKQRLGIGLALLSDPELLILDEPTNGLDPNGIIEVRNLIIDLATNHHKTILISSHLLSEIERIATHVGIIHEGKMLFQGSITDLQKLNKSTLKISCDDAHKAADVLTQHNLSTSIQENNSLIMSYHNLEENAKINRLLVSNGIQVYEIGVERKDLEKLFLDITSQ